MDFFNDSLSSLEAIDHPFTDNQIKQLIDSKRIIDVKIMNTPEAYPVTGSCGDFAITLHHNGINYVGWAPSEYFEKE